MYEVGIMKLEDLVEYNLSMGLADKVWLIVENWTYFQLDTLGIKLNNFIKSVEKLIKTTNTK